MAPWEYREYPELSWSISRQGKLDDCPRAYYYHYYLSHNAWDRDASDDTRLAFRLKQLKGLDALFGHEIDERARELEVAARRGERLPDVASMESDTRDSLNAIWRTSKRQRADFESNPRNVAMLRSVYLEQDAGREIERVEGRIQVCLRALRDSTHWVTMRGKGPAGQVELPAFAPFDFQGVKVYAKPDLVDEHDGVLHVVDWKTGRPKATHHNQMMLSSYWASVTYGHLGSGQVVAWLEYLRDGNTDASEMPDDLEEAARAIVDRGMGRMTALLEDASLNKPKELDAFEKRQTGLCATCNFLPLCKRHSD